MKNECGSPMITLVLQLQEQSAFSSDVHVSVDCRDAIHTGLQLSRLGNVDCVRVYAAARCFVTIERDKVVDVRAWAHFYFTAREQAKLEGRESTAADYSDDEIAVNTVISQLEPTSLMIRSDHHAFGEIKYGERPNRDPAHRLSIPHCAAVLIVQGS